VWRVNRLKDELPQKFRPGESDGTIKVFDDGKMKYQAEEASGKVFGRRMLTVPEIENHRQFPQILQLRSRSTTPWPH
jgi:hypothetical protein